MTDENWTSESDEAPPKKKGFPKWLGFLGCGCLGIVLVVAGGGFFLFQAAKTLADPEVQWPALAEVLPIEEPYPDLTIIGMPVPGFEGMWTLAADDGSTSTVIYAMAGEDGEEMRDGLLSEDQEIDIPFAGGVHDLVKCTIVIQGRELEGARFTSFSRDDEEAAEDEDDDDGFMSEINKAMKKAVIRIDVTPEDSDGVIVIVEYAKLGTLDVVTDEEVAAFLAPFHIGPDR